MKNECCSGWKEQRKVEKGMEESGSTRGRFYTSCNGRHRRRPSKRGSQWRKQRNRRSQWQKGRNWGYALTLDCIILSVYTDDNTYEYKRDRFQLVLEDTGGKECQAVSWFTCHHSRIWWGDWWRRCAESRGRLSQLRKRWCRRSSSNIFSSSGSKHHPRCAK